MQLYQCPNCGRTYNESNIYYCLNCNYRLKKKEDVSRVRNPELSRHNIIGTVSNNNVECPYCHSTNTEKISAVSKGVAAALFGAFSLSRNSKQWHCNNCKSDF